MHVRDIARNELKGGGYLAAPDGSGPHPGVVVIHEAFGLNDNIKNISNRFAEAGYVALAVDLFTDRIRAICMARYMGGLLRGTVNPYGIDDLKAALTYLAKDRSVDAKRLGAVGFCMGGGFVISWACTDSRLKVIAPFYATNPRPLDVVGRRLCPVVGSYPEKDFTANAGRALDKALAEHEVARDIKIYPDARHSFFNESGRTYNEAAAEDSWTRIMKFFGEQIGEQTSA
jgi:carboxymethylenebutenolidase